MTSLNQRPPARRSASKPIFRFGLAALGLLLWLVPTTATAAPEVEEHCIAFASASVAEDADDRMQCYATEAIADRVAASLTGETLPGETRLGETAAQDFSFGRSTYAGGNNTLARHYKNTSYSGSSIRIIGTTCGGGVWWPSGSWNNNIESTLYYCGSAGTKLYNSSSCSGSATTIFSHASSHGWYNNKASCVRYG